MKVIIFFFVLFLSAIGVSAQDATATSDDRGGCPVDRVCLTRDQAVAALQEKAAAKALRIEIAAKDQAYADLLKLTNDVKVELARVSGEKSQLEADRVRWTAVMDVLLKNTRPKKIGLINF